MSAEKFRALFNNPAFAHFYRMELEKTPTDSTSVLGIGRQESKSFVYKTSGDFILSREQLTSIFDKDITDQIFSAVKNDLDFSLITQYRSIAGQEQIVFPDIKFGSASKKIYNILTQIGDKIGSTQLEARLSTYLETNPQDVGHIFGFTNTLLIRTKTAARKSLLETAARQIESAEKIGDPIGIKEARLFLKDTEEQLSALDDFIDSMVTVLEEYDISVSPIKGLDLEVNAKYRKTANNWAFTWEGRAEQQAAGRKLTTILGTIKQTKVGGSGIRGLFASLKLNPTKEIVQKVLKDFIQEFIDKSIASPNSTSLDILKQKTSPALLELIEDNIRTAIGAKPKYNKQYVGNAKLKPIPLVNVKKQTSTSETVAQLKSNKNKIKSLKSQINNELKKVNRIKVSTKTTNLTNLQNLLNARLVDQVKQNMGNGTRNDVLNLQTGRFAESVEVTRLSESRQGMITAFYTYMKNPYATFSAGGRQEYPTSRDPKTLISRSIREIAAEQVSNRLRSVLV